MVEARTWLAGAMSSPLSKRRRSLAVIVALGLGAAACGSGEAAAPSLTLAPQAPSSTAGDPVDDTAAPDTSDDESADESDETAAPELVNLFPDIDVLDVADGSTLNLAAELGGFDKPTLLWFWAPH